MMLLVLLALRRSMQNTVTKGPISAAFRARGRSPRSCLYSKLANICHYDSFGWAKASYLCGLELMNTHMRRALGVCAPYELLYKI